ncbi:MAG: NAD(+)/NADH kinase [Zavarzinella sp.]
MRFIILGNGQKPRVPQEADRLHRRLVELGAEVLLIDLFRERNLQQVQADIALVLGGDGAILRAANQMATNQIPVLGVNLGRLGFLADLDPDEVTSCLAAILQGDYTTTSHLMLECRLQTNGACSTFLGLNEMIVRSGPPFKMLDLEVLVDQQVVSRFLGDGMIISTPIGSTAHSLSAGGPILGQQIDAMVMTPLSGHTLTARPLVDSADKVYTIRVRNAEGAWLVVDGQTIAEVFDGNELRVSRSPTVFRLVKIPTKNYYHTLREKLHWGTTPNYHVEPDGNQ